MLSKSKVLVGTAALSLLALMVAGTYAKWNTSQANTNSYIHKNVGMEKYGVSCRRLLGYR